MISPLKKIEGFNINTPSVRFQLIFDCVYKTNGFMQAKMATPYERGIKYKLPYMIVFLIARCAARKTVPLSPKRRAFVFKFPFL
jgi:uncharacterized membrane protein